MGRRADEPLEKKDIILFKGDWDRLTELLPKHVKPTVFIRALVRKTIRNIEARTDLIAKPVPELKDDDLNIAELVAAADRDSQSSD